jgi:hypothetical protein
MAIPPQIQQDSYALHNSIMFIYISRDLQFVHYSFTIFYFISTSILLGVEFRIGFNYST